MTDQHGRDGNGSAPDRDAVDRDPTGSAPDRDAVDRDPTGSAPDRDAVDRDRNGRAPDRDVVVVGAGFAGLYLLHRLRGLGFSTTVLEAADDVGGTWYWNRYPGARCDIESIDYSYSFDPQLEDDWEWSERYATQPEILRYAAHVADRYDLRRDIRFSSRVESAVWDEAGARWRLRTDGGDEVTCRHYVMATGCLSLPKTPDIPGYGDYGGEVYFTGKWPHEDVDFSGKHVAVIGTGSSGIQSIPLIAEQADRLTVFQRTPNFSMPARNGPLRPEKLARIEGRRAEYREEARHSRVGVPTESLGIGTMQLPDEERAAVFEHMWSQGLLVPEGAPPDLLIDPVANERFCEFLRGKIREVVEDPETAEVLCPTDYPWGAKRPCLDTNYYETFNRPNVRLVDLRSTPIETITATGLDTTAESFELDALVFATGFDAMTGALVSVDITGRDGVTLAEKWVDGPHTYLGLTAAGFPNFFMITGPGSPSVLSNMMVSIEQHVDWVTDCVVRMREDGFDVIEPTRRAEEGWGRHVNDCAEITLYPRASSWYMGANVPGKPRVFLPYVGGVDRYRATCDEVVERDYLGFRRSGPGGTRCNDGLVRRLQPDVAILLDTMEELGLPAIETLSVDEARAFTAAMAAERPPGPDVGEIVDGVLPGADGDLPYRLYRPPTNGPHPIVVYFHGGGWVLGSRDSDDPLCRDLCVRTDAVLVSVDYRHAPEHRFPAAAQDGFVALGRVAERAAELGGDRDRLAVCGWSAGANVATVAARLARDAGGPALAGQLLVNPVTDCDLDRPSYIENAEGYVLTTALMRWFWDHYADPAERTDPLASPIRADDLGGLPPTLVVTSELDPLRDEGAAYARALAAAGVDARHLPCRGQIHTSLTAVDVIISAAGARAEMAAALRRFLGATVAV